MSLQATESSTTVSEKAPHAITRTTPMCTIAEQQEKRTLFTYSEGQKIMRKVDWCLIPILCLVYLMKAMDGSAVSYVKTMNPNKPTNILKQLHMSSNMYAKASPRVHYCRFLWSIAQACQAAAKNTAGLLVARGFLGLFEAGLAPGIWLHLTYWYRPDELGPRMAIISALYSLCNIVNAFLTYGLSFIDGRGGLSADYVSSDPHWVFVIQGLMGIVCVVLVWFTLPNYPQDAGFLTEEEKEWVVGRLPAHSARADDANFSKAEFWAALKDTKTIAFSLSLMFFQSGLLGYLFWLPTIIAGFGISNTATVQLLNIPPAFLYWVGGTVGSWINDRATRVPRAVMFLGACGCWLGLLCCLAFVQNKGALYAIVCLASVFAAWAFNTWLPWRIQSLRGSTHAAFTLAFINGAGQVPGTYTAQIFRSQYAPRYTVPFMVCVAMTAISMVGATILWWMTWEDDNETRRIAALRRKVGKEENRVLEEDVNVDEEVARRNDY